MTPQEQEYYDATLVDITRAAMDGASVIDLSRLDLTKENSPPIIARLSAVTGLKRLLLRVEDYVPDLTPLAALTSLDLSTISYDRITDLTPLAALTSLQELQLANFGLVADLFPLAALRSLKRLSLLNIHRVTNLSPLTSLGSLERLKLYNLFLLTDLSPLGALTSLKSLDLTGCDDLTDLSPLTPLRSLADLDLTRCVKVSEIEPLTALNSLRALRLHECFAITRLEPIRPLIAALEYLDIRDTKIKDVPREVLHASSPDELITNLRAHYADLSRGEVQDAEIKVLLLGNGGAGKTQLSRRLRELPYDDSISSTHGIQLESTTMSVEHYGKSIRLNLWDFGGQEVYHGTHSLFIQGRSVYLILWTPQLEQANTYVEDGVPMRHRALVYWLDYLRTFAGAGNPRRVASPVILIQSKCDREEDCLDETPSGDTADFDLIRIEQVSSKEDLYFDELRTALKKAVRQSLKLHEPDRIGVGRVRIRDRLRDMLRENRQENRTLNHATFDRLCAEDGGISNNEALLDYLHYTGVVFYRPGLFGGQIILDQNWALQAIYTLFDRQAALPILRRFEGRFTRTDLERLAWSQYTPEEQEIFLDMMQSCGICFRTRQLRDHDWEYLAPELMPEWPEARNRMLIGPLEGFPPEAKAEASFTYLHQGILRNYLSKIGEHARGSASYWRYGFALFEDASNSTVLMQSAWNDAVSQTGPGKLTYRAWGGDAKRLVQGLISELEGLAIGPQPTVIWETDHADPSDSVEGQLNHKTQTWALSEISLSPAIGGRTNSGEIYISYAWGDDKSDSGRRRNEIADGVQRCAEQEGWKVRRDRDEIPPGGSISEFMGRIQHGGLVLIVLSERYLQRERCMAELNGIFEDARSNEEEFRRRIVPVVLDDANIGSKAGRSAAVKYWKSELKKIELDLKHLGHSDLAEYYSMKGWAWRIGQILSYISDTLVLWGYDHIVKDDYASLRKLLASRRAQKST